MKFLKKLKRKLFGDSEDGGTVVAKPDPIKQPLANHIKPFLLDPTNPIPVPKPVVPPKEDR